MASTNIHTGSYHDIQDDASPGLVFLKKFLPVVDSVSAVELTKLPKFLQPDATFVLNNGPPMSVEQTLPMLNMRSLKVSKFGHNVYTAWDIENQDGSRTVIYEGSSSTIFRHDPEGLELKIRELNILDLVKASDSGEDSGYKVASARTYMDPAPVSETLAIIERNNR
ncbi:hypothetical protein F5884DRAFT_780920 [Xylogone sp. PMI_703]|nr:hypothetical protein F5884DRAFT_780920 [Xylogone sp. PMI_703]